MKTYSKFMQVILSPIVYANSEVIKFILKKEFFQVTNKLSFVFIIIRTWIGIHHKFLKGCTEIHSGGH